MIPELVLFSRPDCHLCDVASEMLVTRNLPFLVKNIDTDLDLIRRYGVRIPVLFRPDIEAELFWPFSDEDLNRFVEPGQ